MALQCSPSQCVVMRCNPSACGADRPFPWSENAAIAAARVVAQAKQVRANNANKLCVARVRSCCLSPSRSSTSAAYVCPVRPARPFVYACCPSTCHSFTSAACVLAVCTACPSVYACGPSPSRPSTGARRANTSKSGSRNKYEMWKFQDENGEIWRNYSGIRTCGNEKAT